MELESSDGGFYLVNSEGTEVREPENVTYLRARAMAQAPDGMTVRDAVAFHALDPARMPAEAEMDRGVTALAENVVALAHAPKGEDYSGPVLFEGVGGRADFRRGAGPATWRWRGARWRSRTRRRRHSASELEGRMGARVLPDSFDVVDDPTQKEWRGRPLFGSYDVDREGVPAEAAAPDRKGRAQGLPADAPAGARVRRIERPRAHARQLRRRAAGYRQPVHQLFGDRAGGGAEEEADRALPDARQAIRHHRAQDGFSVFGVARRSAAADLPAPQGSGAAGQHADPGVQGLSRMGAKSWCAACASAGLNARSLKDILAAGDDSAVFEFMDSAAPFALIGASGFTAETCVVAPSILIDDLELHPAEEELPKLAGGAGAGVGALRRRPCCACSAVTFFARS